MMCQKESKGGSRKEANCSDTKRENPCCSGSGVPERSKEVRFSVIFYDSHNESWSYSFIFYLLNWMLGHLAMRSEPNPAGPTLVRRTPSYTSPYLSLCPARDNHLFLFTDHFLTSLHFSLHFSCFSFFQ